MSRPLRFIDLFAGLGGFHQALTALHHECVLACEKDIVLNALYEKNYGVKPHDDIRTISSRDLPDHDILCAGFPCQSFSKAGRQEGLECKANGDLINYVLDIIEEKKPGYFILENVPNLERHLNGETLKAILTRLARLYDVRSGRLSPHLFGVPQIRERLFIVGARDGLGLFAFPTPRGVKPCLKPYLEEWPADAKPIPRYLIDCIEVWQEFVESFPRAKELPSFPIWAMEFGADYPLDGLPPLSRTLKEMRQYRGSFGRALASCTRFEQLEQSLPHYALESDPFPEWKVHFIQQNRALYEENKDWIDEWLPKLDRFPHSLQKLEWNCKGEERNIWNYVLQVRASGLRVKRSTTAPSLIAMTTTQVPIIGWEKRYMTPRECAALQSMDISKELPTSPARAYKALGNAVNVDLVRMIAERLLPQDPRPQDSLECKRLEAV